APANSPTYQFQPSTGATSGIASRAIVDDQTCLNCHKGIAAHGGARTEVQYCSVCHNPSSYDASTGNTLDFKVMFHKIHMGANLPSVVAGGSYYIAGYMNHVSDYSNINFPTGDLRTCSMCHNESDTSSPDTVGWRDNPGMEPCGSCHDDVDFVNGKNHLGGVTNAQCATCHGPSSTIVTNSTYKGTLKVADVHVIPELDFQQKIQYQILSVKNSAPGQFPVINFKIVDPTNGSKAWNVLSDEPFTHCNAATDASLANLSLAISWSTTDYTNLGSGTTSEAAQPIQIPVTCAATPPVAVGDGSFTVTSTTAVPSGTTGSAGVMLQGHPAHEFGTANTAWFPDGQGTNREIPIPQTNAMFWAGITDSSAVSRRTVVDVAKCNGCHYQLNGHGNNRVDSVQMCATCHNPDSTDVVARTAKGITWANPDPTDNYGEQTIDLKVLIHAVHAAPDLASYAPTATPYVVYHGRARNWINSTPFPTPVGSGGSTPTINDCTTCHTNDAKGNPTYYPPDPSSSTVLATTINTNGNGPPQGQKAMTAAVAACGACHVTSSAQSHMEQNGGSTRNNPATKDANSQVQSQESCAVCHGKGAIADVAVEHKLSSFPD
ncbi:MAG TPA: OmcA/MtrC family decaheme c-type cytochrome, partial [Mycobacterium sp.]|nr:OmcA/MtrC family decaheme c-type cytochrome [Mycobacterium sp.]